MGEPSTRAQLWLKQYGLTKEEIDSNYFWNESGYYVFNTPHYQCGRNFNETGPKYIIKGTVTGNEMVFNQLLSSPQSTIVITEDAISAIKVSRICSAVPIHKAVIPKELLLRLCDEFKHLIIWLDPDRRSVVHHEARKALPYFDSIRTIVSDKDPKCYSTLEIERILNE